MLTELPDTDRIRLMRQIVANKHGLLPGAMMKPSGIVNPIADLYVRIQLLEERLAVAEGVVSRCGYCGAPCEIPGACGFCGSVNGR